MNTADVVEIFSSIQGEGPHIGERHLFLRLCGCNLRCSFCDTPFDKTEKAAVYTNNGISYLKNPVSTGKLAEEINNFNPINHSYLSITGGEPLLHHKFLKDLIPMIHLPVYLETNGTLYHELEDIINLVSVISADIKLPSSTGQTSFFGEHKKFLETANKYNKEIFFKVVVTSKITEDEIQQLNDFSKLSDLIIQPVNSNDDTLKISQDKLFYLMDKIPGARVIPQCHKFLNIM